MEKCLICCPFDGLGVLVRVWVPRGMMLLRSQLSGRIEIDKYPLCLLNLESPILFSLSVFFFLNFGRSGGL